MTTTRPTIWILAALAAAELATPTGGRVTVTNTAATGTVTATAYAVCAEQ